MKRRMKKADGGEIVRDNPALGIPEDRKVYLGGSKDFDESTGLRRYPIRDQDHVDGTRPRWDTVDLSGGSFKDRFRHNDKDGRWGKDHEMEGSSAAEKRLNIGPAPAVTARIVPPVVAVPTPSPAYKRGGMVRKKKNGGTVRGCGLAVKGHGKLKVY